jgi:hypothetical protein
MKPNGATAHTTVGYMKSERGALGIEEQRTQALRAAVDGEDQITAHGGTGSTGRDTAQTADSRVRSVIEIWEGVGWPDDLGTAAHVPGFHPCRSG